MNLNETVPGRLSVAELGDEVAHCKGVLSSAAPPAERERARVRLLELTADLRWRE